MADVDSSRDSLEAGPFVGEGENGEFRPQEPTKRDPVCGVRQPRDRVLEAILGRNSATQTARTEENPQPAPERPSGGNLGILRIIGYYVKSTSTRKSE